MAEQTGSEINTLEHALDWCLVKKRRVLFKAKKDGKLQMHSYKQVANLPFKALAKAITDGRIFECHYD